MAFVTLEIRTVDLADKLAEFDAAGFELIQCLPHKANFGELGDDAMLFCIFGPKGGSGGGNGNGGSTLALAGPFDKSGDEVWVIAANVTALEEINSNKTKIFTLDGKNQTVNEAVADVREAIDDAL